MKHACEKYTQLTSEQLDRKLSLAERLSMFTHFLMCAGCKHYNQNMLKLHQVFVLNRSETRGNLQLPDEKRERIQESLQKHVK